MTGRRRARWTDDIATLIAIALAVAAGTLAAKIAWFLALGWVLP